MWMLPGDRWSVPCGVTVGSNRSARIVDGILTSDRQGPPVLPRGNGVWVTIHLTSIPNGYLVAPERLAILLE
jgi:hypothetical protein